MSNDYWRKRELQKLKGQLKDVNKLETLMQKEYKKAMEEINSNIAKLFMKYSKDNKLLFAEANKLLTGNKYTEWRMDLSEYIELIEKTADEELLLELNTLSMKSRISRLEETFYLIDKRLNTLYQEKYTGTKALLEVTMRDSYYQNIFNIQKYLGIGKPFANISESAIDEVLSYPWSGANYSIRIWNNRRKLKQVIREEITQMIIQGKGLNEVAKIVSERMDVDYKNAMRLINTEHAYIIGETSARSYEETGVEKYEILATLDIRTSKKCRDEDGEIYSLEERKVGLNYPPFHPNCRTTTIPYFEDVEYELRTARNLDGKTYEVPAYMEYSEWYNKYVK